MKDWIKWIGRVLLLGVIIIDVYILVGFERFCHCTQRWFGIMSPSWERLFIVLQIVGVLHKLVGLPKPLERWALGFLAGLIIADAVIRFIQSLRRTPSSGDIRTVNPNKAQFGLRVFDVWISCMPPLLTWFCFYTVSLYFGACDDDPPGESKVRKWVNSIRPASVPQEAV